jgi:hypothetical protein
MDANKKLMPLKIGDPVIHKATGLCGIVEAVESYGTTDGQMLTVALLNGKRMRGISRDEFGLHTAGAQQVKEQAVRVTGAEMPRWAPVTRDNPRPLTIDGTVVWENVGKISDESILDELC